MPSEISADSLADVARSLRSQKTLFSTMHDASATAVALLPGCDHASLSLLGRRRRFDNVAATSDLATSADDLQVELKQGPCVQAASQQETVHSPDLRAEARWPEWTSTVAVDLGLGSVLSLNLYVDDRALGALNLYSNRAEAFPVDDRASARALSAHVAVAVAAAQHAETIDAALVHRTVIGQAEGMMMQALGLTPDQAFAALVRVSQARNVKLNAVAADIVAHGIRTEMFT